MLISTIGQFQGLGASADGFAARSILRFNAQELARLLPMGRLSHIQPQILPDIWEVSGQTPTYYRLNSPSGFI